MGEWMVGYCCCHYQIYLYRDRGKKRKSLRKVLAWGGTKAKKLEKNIAYVNIYLSKRKNQVNMLALCKPSCHLLSPHFSEFSIFNGLFNFNTILKQYCLKRGKNEETTMEGIQLRIIDSKWRTWNGWIYNHTQRWTINLPVVVKCPGWLDRF